jgi:hypothetical protein
LHPKKKAAVHHHKGAPHHSNETDFIPVPPVPTQVAPRYVPQPKMAPRTGSADGTQDNSEFQLLTERTFDYGDPEQLSSRLADIVKADGFQIQQCNSASLVAFKYDSSTSEDHDKISVVLSPESDHPSERTTTSIRYFRYELIRAAVNREELIPPIGKVRERFNKVVQDFDALEKTFQDRPKP